MAVMPAEPRASPRNPSLHVQPKPGGATVLPRLLLVKLEGTCNEPGLLGDREPCRAEVIAQKVKPALDPTDEGLVGMLFETQHPEPT